MNVLEALVVGVTLAIITGIACEMGARYIEKKIKENK